MSLPRYIIIPNNSSRHDPTIETTTSDIGSSTLLAGVLDRLAEYYGSSAPKAYRALRIDAPDSTPIAEQLDHSDQRLGFSLVGTLPNELDSGDVKLFVRPLDKKQ